MKQAAGEASVAAAHLLGACVRKGSVTVLRTQLWVAGTMQPLNSEQAERPLLGKSQTPPCCSRMRTSDS